MLDSTGTLLDGGIPRREAYAYDTSLRVSGGSLQHGGGPSNGHWFDYDSRGSRQYRAHFDCWADTYTYNSNAAHLNAEHLRDQIASAIDTREPWYSPRSPFTVESFSYDNSGRVVSKQQSTHDSSGSPGRRISFTNRPGRSTYSTAELVVSSAEPDAYQSSAVYEYFYDHLNRRRLKRYPTGTEDEFFYRHDDLLLEERGPPSIWASNYRTVEEYVWLDRRPVVIVRARATLPWWNSLDFNGTCDRPDAPSACGFFFPVTDHIGKPVVLLNSAGQVAGTGAYDYFGHVNRIVSRADTAHPYPTTGVQQDLITFKEPTNSSLSVQLRPIYSAVDTEWNCTGGYYDYAYLWASGAEVAGTRMGGYHAGRKFGPWVTVPPDGQVMVRFSADTSNYHPVGAVNQGACITPGTFAWPYAGVSVEGYEVRRAQAGAGHAWLPLRYPGQYYDRETELFENWNRTYDPSIGRYLQPEPMLQSPRHVVAMAKGGVSVPAYAYAYNNPLHYTDETGLFALKGKCTNWDEAMREAKKRAGCGTGSGGGNDKSCECSKKLEECGSGKCDICKILDNSEPAYIVQNLKCNKQDASGCSNRNKKGYFSVQFDQALCSPPAPASELASVILHEAAHHCRDQTGKAVPDDKSKCSAQAISEACK